MIFAENDVCVELREKRSGSEVGAVEENTFLDFGPRCPLYLLGVGALIGLSGTEDVQFCLLGGWLFPGKAFDKTVNRNMASEVIGSMKVTF